MTGFLLSRPLLASLLVALTGLVFILVAPTPEFRRTGLAITVSLAPMVLLLGALLGAFFSKPALAKPALTSSQPDPLPNMTVIRWTLALFTLAWAIHGVVSYWLWCWAGDPSFAFCIALGDVGFVIMVGTAWLVSLWAPATQARAHPPNSGEVPSSAGGK